MGNSVYVNVALATAGIVAAAAASGFLTMFSFAVASYKYAWATKSPKNSGIDATAKRLLYSSGKIASIVFLAKRFALLVSLACLFCIFSACADAFENGGAKAAAQAAAFVPVGAAFLWLQYAMLEMTAIKVGKNCAEAVLGKYSRAFYSIYILMLPLYYLSKWVNGKISKRLKFKKQVEFESIDIELMLSAKDNEGGAISPYAGKIVRNAVRLREFDVSDVMLPRSKVDYIDLDSTAEENLELVKHTRRTRYPICKDNLDDCFGFVHIKDIFGGNVAPENIDFMKIRRDTMRLRESENLESALAKMLKYRLQLAIVEDEFGGVIGVLTLDNALSELVGQIKDEFSDASQESVCRVGKNKYRIMGFANLRKVEDFLDVDFDSDEVSTFGGLITYKLGRFPDKGERVHFPEQHMCATITKVDARAVVECEVSTEEKEDNE